MSNKIKHWIRDLFRYPTYRPADASYDAYWYYRDMGASLNAFQRARASLLISCLSEGDSVFDVGCGDGRVLAYVGEKCRNLRLSGLDSSEAALESARSRGVNAVQGNIGNPKDLPDIGMHNWVTLFEVIEHVPHSEALLKWAHEHARKGVIFSVPNTGFFVHRLRLILGRFPLQWRAHPSEHIRFWTMRDMRWWLKQLEYRYEIQTYEGMPFLNRLWPSLFAAGLIVIIR